MKKQNLTDGKHWIVTLDMPGGGFESYYVIWDTNPLEDSKFMLDYMTTWENDYVSNYGDYEKAELITQDIVDDYGEDYFNKQSWYN